MLFVLGRLVRAAAWAVAAVLLVVLAGRLTGAGSGRLWALALGALPLTLLPAYAVALVAVLQRRRLLGLVAAVLVVGHVLVVAPALGAADVPGAARQAPRLRVVAANVFFGNLRGREAGAALRALHPDVLVLSELRPLNLPGLRESGLFTDLPYTTMDGGPLRDVEVFSRLPLRDMAHRDAVPDLPQPRAVVEVAGTEVRIAGEHTLPPTGTWEDEWRGSLGDLAREMRVETLPVVAIGDLNATRDHAPLREVLGTGMRDAADERGRGLARTWPQRLPVLTLDHVLVRDGRGGRLVVLDSREAALPGSDHLAVLADLAVLPS
jgi:endonuclease/exonuclease/phosphatase (EEP) superfamily protein YafD